MHRVRVVPTRCNFLLMALFLRLLRDDNGQDLIEYALLTAAIGLAGLLTFETIRTTMGLTYLELGHGGEQPLGNATPTVTLKDESR